MGRLAVMAHYDPRGFVGPHVRRQVEALASSVTDLVIVTTADLQTDARAFLESAGRLIERANYGYDFFSYKVGIDSVKLDDYTEVTLCNDTYVGPLTDYPTIFEAMARQPVDFWGLTEADRISHHVQSFFVTFRPWVVESSAFRHFWENMTPLSHRGQVIRRYEVGMSTDLYDAGFASAAYFVENDADRRLARSRVRWWAARRTGIPRRPQNAALWQKRSREPWNPSVGLADRALENARLPYVKIDTLRFDPYDLGANRLLRFCEETYPQAFAGVRDFLDSSAPFYPPRPGESFSETPLMLRPARALVEYHRAS
jgi:hypothetical protein